MARTFSVEELRRLGLPFEPPEGGQILQDRIVYHSRWSVHHELVVHFPEQPEGEAYLFEYSVGATESQDERPWQDEKFVTPLLVRQAEKVIKVWERV